METMENQRHMAEVAGVFRSAYEAFLTSHRLCQRQQKAFDDILSCRTSALGGHVNTCDKCGFTCQSYNSCHNRHCPKCQFLKQEQWVDKLKGRLIPGRYFHIVFSFPQLLNGLFYINQPLCYRLLFDSASQALQNAGRNPRFLGAQTGAVAVLHTWGQTLSYHPHIHMLVPAGGLSEDGTEWVNAQKKFFVPVKALSVMFRGIYTRLLKKHLDKNDLKLPNGFPGLDTLKKALYEKNWNVYAKKALGGINSVLAYLGRYTHRVAISNSRLVRVENGQVTFRYKNYRNRELYEIITISCVEFTRRFMMHILPAGFCKIRYYGILATANIETKRQQAIALIGKTILLPRLEGLTACEVYRIITGNDPSRCPKCRQGRLVQSLMERPPE
jgi:predicted Zn-ribbon and HTH transcriptional regulator